MKSWGSFYRLKEDMARDMGASVFGGNSVSAADAEAMGPFIELAKEIWSIDREGMMNFFKRYEEDSRADGTRIKELIDELQHGKSRVSKLFRKNQGDEDNIVPSSSDLDAGDGEGGE